MRSLGLTKLILLNKSYMKYEYIRIDLFNLMPYGVAADWFHKQPDCEFREDYQCFFILKGSKTHTMAALKFGELFGKD